MAYGISEGNCPSADELTSFARGDLSDDILDRIAEHLERCPSCNRVVCDLELDAENAQEGGAHSRLQRLHDIDSADKLGPPSTTPTSSETPSSASSPPFPRHIRDYELLGELGAGGMGQVFKAVHRKLRRFVAIKVLPRNRLADSQVVERFQREMAMLGKLDHPHIVRAFDAGEQEGWHFLVMEFIEGLDLGKLVARHRRLPIPEACLIIRQAAVALQHAHDRNLVHRDVKPSNLMLAATSDGIVVKVLDLGLARALGSDDPSTGLGDELTSPHQIMGTLEYMAPEQIADTRSVDIRADIYGLGATLYKLLTGECPHEEQRGRPLPDSIHAVLNREPTSIQRKRPEVPPALADIVHKMLAKRREDRFATPAMVADALEPFCQPANLESLLASVDETLVDQVTPQAGNSEQPVKHSSFSRKWLPLTLKTAVLVTSIAIGGWLAVTFAQGKVVAKSTEGVLPSDLRILLTRNGEAVSTLDARNSWTTRLANNRYAILVEGGSGEFEPLQTELEVSRLDTAVVLIRRKPKEEAQAAENRRGDGPLFKRNGVLRQAGRALAEYLDSQREKPAPPTTEGGP